jgi:hypothetical protein
LHGQPYLKILIQALYERYINFGTKPSRGGMNGRKFGMKLFLLFLHYFYKSRAEARRGIGLAAEDKEIDEDALAGETSSNREASQCQERRAGIKCFKNQDCDPGSDVALRYARVANRERRPVPCSNADL